MPRAQFPVSTFIRTSKNLNDLKGAQERNSSDRARVSLQDVFCRPRLRIPQDHRAVVTSNHCSHGKNATGPPPSFRKCAPAPSILLPLPRPPSSSLCRRTLLSRRSGHAFCLARGIPELPVDLRVARCGRKAAIGQRRNFEDCASLVWETHHTSSKVGVVVFKKTPCSRFLVLYRLLA